MTGVQTCALPILLQLKIKHLESPRVVTGDEVDMNEAHVIEMCPALRIEEVRRFSYANLLYREVRSSYAHEYGPGVRSCQWPMTSKEGAHVSYVNRLVHDNDRLTQIRLIHFHAEWLADIAVSVAENLSEKPTPVRRPELWWTAGGG